MCGIYDALSMLFSGYSCSYACWVHGHFQRMLLFSMCRWSQNFRAAGASWEGRRRPVLAPLLAATVAAFCRALTKMRMAIHTGDRFWEKTPLHVAASDTNLGRDLSEEAWPFLGSANSLFRSRKESETYLSLQGTTAARRKGVR